MSGFEPLTCRLQEVRPGALCVLAAPMTQGVALTAPAALGLPAASVHEPVHARHSKSLLCVVSTASGNLPWDAKATQNDHSAVQERLIVPD